MRVPKKEVFVEGLKALQILLQSKSDLLFASKTVFIEILEQTLAWIKKEPSSEKSANDIKKKALPEVFGLVKTILNHSSLINH